MTSLEDRNMCLVVVDSLTAFNLEDYGYDRQTAPFLSKVADEGVFCKYAYSNAPWTFPSHASMFSGKLPVDHEATSATMSFEDESFVEELSERGYGTHSYSVNSLIAPKLGITKGFDEAFVENEIFFENEMPGNYDAWKRIHEENYSSELRRYLDFAKSALKKREFKSLEFGLKQLLDDRGLINHQYFKNHGADELNELVSWKLDQKVISDKFFLFLNYMEVHGYGAPEQLVEDWIDHDEAMEVLKDLDLIPEVSEREKELVTGLYDGQIKYTDIRLKNLVEEVREDHPDTVFIFTSDHGQNSGHYGLWNHQYGIWERLIRVPLVIWGEDIPNIEIEENVALRDLHDLILGKTEIEDLGKEKIFAEYYGAKNFTVKFGGRDIERYSEDKHHLLENTSKVVVKGKKGYIRNSHIDDFVFEAGMDGFSEESLDPDDHQDLRQEIEERFGDHEGSSDDVERSKDEEVKDKLRDLGYMQ